VSKNTARQGTIIGECGWSVMAQVHPTEIKLSLFPSANAKCFERQATAQSD
jgi:hypothetical protein